MSQVAHGRSQEKSITPFLTVHFRCVIEWVAARSPQAMKSRFWCVHSICKAYKVCVADPEAESDWIQNIKKSKNPEKNKKSKRKIILKIKESMEL